MKSRTISESSRGFNATNLVSKQRGILGLNKTEVENTLNEYFIQLKNVTEMVKVNPHRLQILQNKALGGQKSYLGLPASHQQFIMDMIHNQVDLQLKHQKYVQNQMNSKLEEIKESELTLDRLNLKI
jgi:hypothetical protein